MGIVSARLGHGSSKNQAKRRSGNLNIFEQSLILLESDCNAIDEWATLKPKLSRMNLLRWSMLITFLEEISII